uniref:Translin-associated factor X-interacting protein 1 N-terminal domain-containing protein n=1 Tax=Chlamydomonas euryale TaxID=1486919 RepID=A0A7R9YQV2_9CHLO|mmetsp:Transcript_1298/g.3512  ORF Transcript_1298/g.3512 Transcript_1298/m.3512 type:complete len:309 (+) Transcript_1298:195-1121(+)
MDGEMQTAHESVLLQLLTERQDRKDTRVFAHAAAETQTVIKDVYKPESRGGAPQAQEPGFLEVFPKVASRPPRLLQDLESSLIDRLRANDKSASTAPLVTKERDPGMAANLSLDAHRHVFAEFIQGFTTYSSLLSAVQADFDIALNQGAACAAENVDLRARIHKEQARRDKAQSEMRSKIMAGELEYRKEAFARLQELKVRMDRAVKRAGIAERDLGTMQKDEQRMRDLVSKLTSQNAQLEALQKAEVDWAASETAPALASMPIGPLEPEDEVWLEQEYVSPEQPPVRADSTIACDPGQAGIADSPLA